MTISRRRFLRNGALAGATLAVPGPLQRALFAPLEAGASGVVDPILVVVQLEGGNDGLNTVIPVDGAQRTAYAAARPSLQISVADLAATTLDDPDPTWGNALALHPSMGGLKGLYDAGKVAILNGVAYPSQSLSHFRSEDIWFSADPLGPFSDGWFGRYLDDFYDPTDLVTVDVDDTLSKMFFSGGGANVLAVRALSQFALPDDPLYPDAAAKKAALEAVYAVEADPGQTSGLQNSVGISGEVLLSKMDEYDAVDTHWGAALDDVPGQLAQRLAEAASIIRHDAVSGSPVGARYFHVRLGGFDTHTNQGTLAGRQASLLTQVSECLTAFYTDLQSINVEAGENVSERVLTLTFSEFGRRIAENGSGGTDHGQASVLFAMGDSVNGGIYGGIPSIAAPNSVGNLVHHTDFRQVYATIIDNWLATAGTHTSLIPNGPFTTLGFL
ncbi:MAG: DUF1501 domain-containing protein [Deltaproteobacteria bacterium]|nr:DUF1501 domain-containing protein [Deltaproteobacteria bacterium]